MGIVIYDQDEQQDYKPVNIEIMDHQLVTPKQTPRKEEECHQTPEQYENTFGARA